MLVTLVFSRIYERRYEGFNKSREYYYAEMQISNEVDDEAEYIRKRIKEVNDVAFFEWTTLQSIVTLFQFYILYLITKDIFAGTKHISDMVLIFGYTKETQVFLNAITGMIERLMEVRAGAERLVVVSNKEEPVSSIL
jgi:ABC-type multidrug transport system fused ATPase/permease subunit